MITDSRFRTTIFVILLLLCPLLSFPQKVAVVLSGGGAKGVAHIGVLKALEENHIPVDYIAGTSMGAIIGSLYASGYSPGEIEEIVTADEFQNWAWGKIEDKYIYYFKKKPPNASWVNFKFNYDSIWQYKLPTNIISPYQVDFGLMYYLASPDARAAGNFDSLFIPFRCVAADIAQKKAVAFQQGYLPEAVRASMAYPFYFRPITIDGQLLYDGGMYNNFPSDVALEHFNPDIIIGSNVALGTADPDEADIISIIENMLMTNTNYSTLCDNGVMIIPELQKTGEFDFTHAREFIASGYRATIDRIDEIRQFVTDSVSPEQVQARRNAWKNSLPPLVFDSIGIKGLNPLQSFYIQRLLGHRKTRISADELKMEYFRLLADDKIETIYPRAVFNRQHGTFDLLLKVKRDKNFAAQFGGIISSGPITGAFIGLEYKYLGAEAASVMLNSYIGRFYTSLQLQNRTDFPTKKPVYWQTEVTYNQWDFFKTTTRFFEDEEPSYLIQNEYHISSNFGVPARQKGKFETGFAFARMRNTYYQTNMFIRSDTADRSDFDLFTSHLRYERNTLNEFYYPYDGTYLFAGIRHVIGTERYTPGSTAFHKLPFRSQRQWLQFNFRYENYCSSLGIFRLGFHTEMAISGKPLFHDYTSSTLSAVAFQPTPESRSVFLPEYRANIWAAAGIKLIVTLYKKITLRTEGYIFQPYQAIKADENSSAVYGKPFVNRSFLGNAALVYHSPLGPVSLSTSYYQRSHQPFSVMFNIGYIIFNKRALD